MTKIHYFFRQMRSRINTTVKYILNKAIFDRQKKKRSTVYWWYLHEQAQKPGLWGYMKKKEYNALLDRYNAFIPLVADFSDMPVLPHGPCGIFISSGAKIGYNCTIFHQVTIGSNNLPDSSGVGAPVIGNNVYIGCGAKIIGNVTIGDNVRIGANCVVTCDVPAYSTVVMPKPRIIPKDNTQNIFIPFNDNTE